MLGSSGRRTGLLAVTVPGTGDGRTQRRAVTVVSTGLAFSPVRALRTRVAFLQRVYEALARSKRHRNVAARIATNEAREPGSGVHATHRLHRCPWCGTQAAYLFSCEVGYPDSDVLSERWRCAHCGGDHTRKI